MTALEAHKEIEKWENYAGERRRLLGETQVLRPKLAVEGTQKDRAENRRTIETAMSELEDAELVLEGLREQLTKAQAAEQDAVKKRVVTHAGRVSASARATAQKREAAIEEYLEMTAELAASNLHIREANMLARELGEAKIELVAISDGFNVPASALEHRIQQRVRELREASLAK